MEYFRDFNADIGGYIRKDKLWWYGCIDIRKRASDIQT